MDDSLIYEQFIKRSWDVERFKKGANADTWQGLLMANINYNEAIGSPSEEKTHREFEKRFAKVKNDLHAAYGNVFKKADKVISNHTDLQVLLKLGNGVAAAENPQQLFTILRRSFEIVNEHKL